MSPGGHGERALGHLSPHGSRKDLWVGLRVEGPPRGLFQPCF